jgi:hypothetical protein
MGQQQDREEQIEVLARSLYGEPKLWHESWEDAPSIRKETFRHLARLRLMDGTNEAVVSLMTGLTTQEIRDLGGVPE